MTPERDPMFDDRIADWLEADPDTAPRQLLETVVAAVPSIPQRQARPVWWIGRTWPVGRLALAAVLVAALGLVGLALLRGPTVGPHPSPTPVATPAFGLLGVMVPFTSPRYGYSIDHPAEWSVREATEGLVELGAPWVDSTAVDYIAASPVGSIQPGIIVSATELTPGRTLEEWTRLTTEATCGAPESREPIAVDGETGTLLTYPDCFGYHHLWTTVVHGTTGFHIVWIGWRGTEPEARALFEQVVATFRFASEGPTQAPSAPFASGPVLRPIQAGDPIPDTALGEWYHTAAFFWVLRAGDPSCLSLARTSQDCGLWDPITVGPLQPGTMTVVDGQLVVHWWNGGCGGQVSRYTIATAADTLALRHVSGCDSGDLTLTRAGTGTAPTAPPKPAS